MNESKDDIIIGLKNEIEELKNQINDMDKTNISLSFEKTHLILENRNLKNAIEELKEDIEKVICDRIREIPKEFTDKSEIGMLRWELKNILASLELSLLKSEEERK